MININFFKFLFEEFEFDKIARKSLKRTEKLRLKKP